MAGKPPKPPRATSRKPQRTTRGGPVVTSRTQQPTTRTPIRNPAQYTGRIGNQYVGASMWDPRGFWVQANYLTKGQNLHIYPDGRTVLVKHPGASAGPTGIVGPAGAAPPAPAAPAAPAGPQYSLSNLPVDPAYDAAELAARRARDTALANLVGERTRGLSDYGFTEGPTGTLAFDPNNPLSKAAQLKLAYDTNRRATGLRMGASGNLYSGSYQNSQDIINRGQVGAEDAQLKAVQSFLAQNTSRRAGAQSDYESAVGQAYGDRVARFESNPLYQPATAEATTDAVAATPASPAKASAAAGRPVKTVRGRRFYQRASDKKWIPF